MIFTKINKYILLLLENYNNILTLLTIDIFTKSCFQSFPRSILFVLEI